MNIILLSGGSGKRLWPLSNDIRSKQFIKIFKKEDGTYESMVQRVYRQIKKVDTDATVTIATSKTQVSAIHNQLGEDVGISVEPCRRDTFPAIALATAYLVDVMHIDPSESVVVCPVDPYVEDNYFEALKKLSEQADKCDANLVLMGIEPTYPSEKYGYIIPESADHVATVQTFKEKPTADVAEQYKEQALAESEQMAEQIEQQIEAGGLQNQVEVDFNAEYVKLTLNGAILFDSAKANIREDAQPLIAKIGTILENYDSNVIEIEGHTDNVPIHSSKYENNNVLSMYRALSVADFIRDNTTLDPALIKSSGRGEYVPVADNTTEEGRARNRRVEIKVYNSYNSGGATE